MKNHIVPRSIALMFAGLVLAGCGTSDSAKVVIEPSNREVLADNGKPLPECGKGVGMYKGKQACRGENMLVVGL